MNIQSLNNHNDVKKKFDNLLESRNEQEEQVHEATMLSLQFISSFNELMGNTVTKKEIADSLGTSRSYVTQLFNGSKLLNLQTIIKIQKILKARVSISMGSDSFKTKNKEKKIAVLPKNEKQINLNREKTISLI